MGVANDRSIAWGVAQEIVNHGGEVILTFQGDALRKRVMPLAESIKSEGSVIECDVSKDDSIKGLFEQVKKMHPEGIDFVVHSIAFANKENLKGLYCETSRSDFAMAMDISCYSFVSVANHARSTMKDGGCLLAMSYFGAEKVVPNYNVMGVAKSALESSVMYLASDLGQFGVRVNSISPGPIKTLAASGISGFNKVLSYQEKNSPLRKNVTQSEVGKVAVFLISGLASGITGENIHVDAGYNVVGMPRDLAEGSEV